MLGGISPLSNLLGSAPTGEVIETLRYRNYAKSLATAGLHLLLIAPGTKIPVDMRSSVQKRTDDAAAREAAKAAGRPDWVNARSGQGVHLATDNPKLLTRYIDNYRKTYGETTPVNMAVAVGPSRLVIVDCDTEEQVVAFLRDAGIPTDTPLPPTVRSPGQRDAEGNWIHYGGGHYWFTLPEGVDLPTGSGSVTMPGGYAILWDGRYVLIPPSIRPEGWYVAAGQDYPAPEWILERIRKHAQGRTDRRKEFGAELGELSENIDAWSQLVSWVDLLEPAGWIMAARPDGCGCQVWTAPGVHASPKSATAHDTGCTYGRYSDVNAPLHVWTDNPGEPLESWLAEHGSKTISKLQLTAVLNYGGNVGTACAELGVIPRDDLGLDVDAGMRESGLSASNLDQPMNFDEVRALYPDEDYPEDLDMRSYIPRPGEYDNGGLTGGMISKTNDTDAPIPVDHDPINAFDALKNPAVDEAIARAKEFAESQNGTLYRDVPGQPVPEQDYTPPPTVAVRPGDVWRDEFEDMLSAEGFTEQSTENGAIEFGSSEDVDGRTLRVEFDRLTMVVTTLSVSGDSVPFITLTPLPDNGPVSGHTVPEQEQASGPDTLPITNTPSDPPPSDPPQFSAEGGEFEDGVLEAGDRFMPRIALLDYWRDYPAPEFVVDGWIENGGMAAIIGPSGVGKTTVVIDILGAIATGQQWHGCKTMQQRVLYMPGEGMSGSIQRMKAWEKAHKANTGTEIAVAEGILKAGAPPESWATLVRLILDNRIGVLVFDTFARMAVGVEENSADAIGKVVERLDQVRKITGVTVLLLHHTSRGTEHGRGSTALNGALDSEILVTGGWFDKDGKPLDSDGTEGEPITARISKQKNAGCASPQLMRMVPWEDSVVMTGPSGVVGDVFDEIAVTRAVLPEPTLETAVRVAKVLDDFTQQGLTVAEAAAAVPPDEWTARLSSVTTMWKLALRKAIDLGLRLDLFETLSGKASGSRYIRTGMSIEAFRKAAITDGLSDD